MRNNERSAGGTGDIETSRRGYLRAVAGAGAVGVTALAGCMGSGAQPVNLDPSVPTGTPTTVETKYWHDWPNIDAESPPMEYTAKAGSVLDPVTIEFSTEDDPWMREHAFMIQRSLRDLGVRTSLDNRPLNQLYAQSWTTAGLENMISMSTHGPDPQRGLDPNPLVMRRYKANPSNYDNYWHPDLNDLLDRQRRLTGDREKRKELVDEAQQIFAEDVGGLITLFPDVITAVNERKWDGYVMTPGNGPTGDSFQWTEVNLQPETGERAYVKGTSVSMSSLNLPWSGGGAGAKRLTYIYDGLFDASPELEVVPALATSAEFVDDTTVEMSLREGVTWHDGEPFTAEDVKFSVNFYQQYSAVSQAPFYGPIDSVEVLGDHDVRFNLTRPDAAFLTQRVVRSVIIPKHRWADVDSPTQYNPTNPIGTGPFEFESWSQSSKFVVSRNDDHWMWDDDWRATHLGEAAERGPGIERVIWVNVGNVNALIGGLQNEKIDAVAGRLSNAQAERVADTDAVEKKVANNFAPLDTKLMFSVPLIRDKEFRVALAKAVDKQGFVEQVLQGRATVPPGENFISDLTIWHNDDSYDYGYDVEEARTILERAGYTWDDAGNLRFPNGDAWAAFVERIQNGNCHQRRTELDQPNFADQ
ncbi:ABC transporter substrate-binding protein (plasmid) [Halarchaeum sp. CBA1220]|uniref:ABC transporter substrate-binding protein n=1 Tax=Halarchaeum sp. CBA1220 TaxID=1853682 RepID=UPI000F3A9885|nr:ABC transporter substrate-binding protein [Halarchaeum sp. CBA1220]